MMTTVSSACGVGTTTTIAKTAMVLAFVGTTMLAVPRPVLDGAEPGIALVPAVDLLHGYDELHHEGPPRERRLVVSPTSRGYLASASVALGWSTVSSAAGQTT